MRWFAILFIVLLVLLRVTAPGRSQDAVSAERALFIDAPDTARAPLRPAQVGTTRTRTVRLDRAALDQARSSGSLTLNLFDDVRLVADITRTEPRALNRPGAVWYGTLPGVAHSGAALVVAESGALSGSILTPGWTYTIAPLADGLHSVSEINTFAQRPTPQTDDSVIPPPGYDPGDDGYVRPAGARDDDGSVIDLMIVYTPAALAMAGSDDNMLLAAETSVALANLTYANSLINFRLRLVYAGLVDYVERPQTGSDLDELTGTADGYMDEVHALRNTHAADLVTLIPGTPVAERNYCGVAWLPGTPDASLGFSVVEMLCISDITLAHELGHNMGSAHDRANGGGGRTYYAYGYQDPRADSNDWGDFVTVMAYSTGGDCPDSYLAGACPAIAWWSNPDQTYNGKPLGYPLSGGSATHNSLSLNEVAFAVANYRVSDDGGAMTPTPEVSPTHTPAVPTATATPGPDVTPIGGSELLLNGGFEFDADADGIPDGWKLSGRSGDARVCSGARSGSCAYRAKGGAAEDSILAQTIPLATYSGTETLTLTAHYRSTGITGGAELRLVVLDDDPLTPPEKHSQLMLPNIADYTLLNAVVSLPAGPLKFKVQVRYRSAAGSGRFWVDDASLKLTAP